MYLFVVLLFTEGTSVSEIYFHYSSKTDFSLFPAFACILFQLFVLPVLLREVNPTDETDPFVVFMVCSGLFKLLILMNMEFPGGNKPFN